MPDVIRSQMLAARGKPNRTASARNLVEPVEERARRMTLVDHRKSSKPSIVSISRSKRHALNVAPAPGSIRRSHSETLDPAVAETFANALGHDGIAVASSYKTQALLLLHENRRQKEIESRREAAAAAITISHAQPVDSDMGEDGGIELDMDLGLGVEAFAQPQNSLSPRFVGYD